MTDNSQNTPATPSAEPHATVEAVGGGHRATARSASNVPAENTRTAPLTMPKTGGRHSITLNSDGSSSYEFSGPQKATSSAPAASTGPVFKSAMGSTVEPSKVKDSDLVTVGGMTTNVRAAINAGLLDANFRAVAGNSSSSSVGSDNSMVGETGQQAIANEQAERQAEQAKARPAVPGYAELQADPSLGLHHDVAVPLDSASETLMTKVVQSVEHGAYASAVGAHLAGRDVPADTVQRIANSLGMSPGEAKQAMAQMQQAMEHQAVNAVGAEVLEWARSAQPEKLQAAAQQQALQGSLRGYGDLQKAYIGQLDRLNPAAIVNSPDGRKMNARIEQNGEVSLDIPGVGRTTWGAALRGGLIGPYYANQEHVARRQAAQAVKQQQQAQQPQAAPSAAQYPQPTAEHVAQLRAYYAQRNLPLQQRLAMEKAFDNVYGKGAAARHGYTH